MVKISSDSIDIIFCQKNTTGNTMMEESFCGRRVCMGKKSCSELMSNTVVALSYMVILSSVWS